MRPNQQSDLQFLGRLAERLEREKYDATEFGAEIVDRLRKIVSTGKGVGYVFSAVEPIHDTDDATTIIAKLRMTLQQQAGEYASLKRHHEWLLKKHNILTEAFAAQAKVEQTVE